MSFNQLVLSGRFGRDPEMKTTQSGTDVCKFSIAVDDGWGENKSTMWVNCVAFKKTAQNINKFFSKGDRILVSGELSIRKYTDGTGAERYATECRVFRWEFMGGAKGGRQADTTPHNTHATTPTPEPAPMQDFDDDVPF